MAFAHSPKIVTDGMVFYYDTGNSKSYAGEPTENLISPEGLTFTQITTYTDMLHSQVVDSSSPSGYACEMEIGALPVNNSARARFGFAANIPTSGTAYVTVYAKFEGGTVADIRPAIYSGASWQIMVPLDGGSIYLTDEYRRFGVLATLGTGSGGPNPGFSMTYSNSGGAIGQKTRWHSPQVEVKSHATPFINGTRSVTEALKDFTKNATLDLSNVSFDSNAQMTFDGTTDYVTVPHNPAHSFTGDFSIEIVFRPTGNTANCLIQKGSGSDYFQEYWVLCDTRSSNRQFELIMGKVGNTSANYNVNASNSVTIGQYHHIVTGVQGSTGFMYVNGELIDTGAVTDRIQSTSDIRIGERIDGFADSLGDQPITKIYNRALAAEEVQQNFNTIKGRFGI